MISGLRKTSVKLSNVIVVLFLCSTAVLFLLSCDKEESEITQSVSTSRPVSLEGVDFNLLETTQKSDTTYSEGVILQNQSNNVLFQNRKWQGTASIGIDRYKNLFVGWISGGDGEGNENYITLSLSKDNGQTWMHDKLVVCVKPADSTRLMDVSFFNDRFSNLYMAWSKKVEKKGVKEWSVVWYTKLKLNNDNTIEFTPPRRIAEGSMLNKPCYSNITKKLYFPIAVWFWGDASIYEAQYDSLNKRNLVGFKKDGYLPIPKAIKQIHEHMMVELSDSTFFAMVRTADGIYYSKSKDAIIWDEVKKFTGIGSTTSSRFFLKKLQSGRLLLIANNSTIRRNLRAFLSDDDGKTWKYSLMIDTRYWVSYPDAVEDQDGVLKVVYDFERKPTGTIYYLTFSENDILTGNEKNIKKIVVNTLL